MEHKSTIRANFHTAVRWNVIGYVIQRIAYTILSIYMYTYLPAHIYVAWSTYLSVMYMAIFMCDAGLRKSIPLYIQNVKSYVYMSIYIIIGALIAGCMYTSFHWFIPYAQPMMHATYIMPMLVLSQTCIIGMRIVYKSQFNNRTFAYISGIWPICEVIAAISLLTYTHYDPIAIVMASKAAGSICAIIHAWIKMPARNILYTDNTEHEQTSTFAQHTGYMWLTALVKSLSERHIIMPLVAWTTPAHLAATYKVVHDAVMVIYRTLIKGIDVNDTAILRNPDTRQFAFFQLSIKLINWSSLAMLALPCMSYALPTISGYDLMAAAIGYASIMEVVAIPWERTHEIMGNYRDMLILYTIMFIVPVMFILTTAPITTYNHLVLCISLVAVTRVISLWGLSIRTIHEYSMQYPWRYATCMLLCAATISIWCMWP